MCWKLESKKVRKHEKDAFDQESDIKKTEENTLSTKKGAKKKKEEKKHALDWESKI